MRAKCTNMCLKYGKRAHTGRYLYLNGKKFCRFCHVSIEYDGDASPCCRLLLRTRSLKSEKPTARLNVIAMPQPALQKPKTAMLVEQV